jgi:hypothetical protein
MTDKHTPGPWRYVPWHIEEGPSAVYDANGNLVCTSSSDDTARLIAAAPDMLEALRELTRTCKPSCPAGVDAIHNARVLIAKADGWQ